MHRRPVQGRRGRADSGMHVMPMQGRRGRADPGMHAMPTQAEAAAGHLWAFSMGCAVSTEKHLDRPFSMILKFIPMNELSSPAFATVTRFS